MNYKLLVCILCIGFTTSLATASNDLAHESTHKAISETKYAKKLINEDQEEAVAKIVGKQARHVAKAFKDKQSSEPNAAATDHIEWNKKNREALKANNERLKAINSNDVKASPWLLADRSPTMKDDDPWKALDNKLNEALENENWEEAKHILELYKKTDELKRKIPIIGHIVKSLDNVDEGEYREALQEVYNAIQQTALAVRTGGVSLLKDIGVDIGWEVLDVAQDNFFDNGGGKNDKHMNPVTKEAAAKKLKEAEENLEKYERESLGDKGRQKKLDKLRAKVKHYQREKDKTGETHSRNAKGNKGRRK